MVSHLGSVHPVGRRLFGLMCAVIIFSAIWIAYQDGAGTVDVLVLSSDGARTQYTLSIKSGELANPEDVSSITQVPQKYFLNDGSIIGIEAAGIVRRIGSSEGAATVLVASAIPASDRTPYAVWGEGARVAWVNPADRSVQVFERTERGSYSPVAVDTSVKANSIIFSEDGTTLYITALNTESTDVFKLGIGREVSEYTYTLPGLVMFAPQKYD